jgi:hypothetical protein
MGDQQQSVESATLAAAPGRRWPALALLMLIALAHGLIYAVGIPRWQAPDEPMLFEYAALTAHLGRPPTAWERDLELEGELAASLERERFYRYTLDSEPATIPATLDEARALFYMPRQVGGDPPLYFLFAALALRLVPGWSIEAQLTLLRVLNALLLPLAVACVYHAARAMAAAPGAPPSQLPDSLFPIAAASLVALQPMATVIGAAMNNDGPANLLGAGLCLFLVLMARSGFRGRDIILFGALTLLALTVKRTALPYVLLTAGLTIFWAARQWRGWARPRRWAALAPALIGLFAGAAWLSAQLAWHSAARWYDAGTLSPASREPADDGYALILQPGQEVIQVLPDVATTYLRNNVLRAGARVWGDGPVTGRLVLYSDGRRQEQSFSAESAATPELAAPVSAYAQSLRLGIVADSGPLYITNVWAHGIGMPGNLIANGDLSRPALREDSPLLPTLRYLRAEELAWAFASERLRWGLPLGLWIDWLFASFWGHFGWLSIPYVRGSAWTIALWAMCASGLAGAGLAAVRLPGWRRSSIIALLLLIALAFVPLLLNSLVEVSPIQQGRYLFPVLPAVALLIALGQEALLPARWRALWLLAWLGFWLAFALGALVCVAGAYR